MMKKNRLVLSLLLIIVQAFFIILPVFAAEETTEQKLVEKTVSFSETTIDEDMEDKVADLVKLFGVVDQKVSLISFAAERNADSPESFFNLYFYVYIPGSKVSRYNTAKVSLSKERESGPFVVDMKQIDRKGSVYKFAAMKQSAYFLNYDNKESISFYVHNFLFDGTTYPAVGYGMPRGEAEAGLSLNFDVDQSEATLKSTSDDGQMKKYTMKAPKALKDDTLTLNTTLVSERVTTKYPDKYMQINTALITIPNEYYEAYGKLVEVEYKYSLWDKVPMVVTDREPYMKKLVNKDSDYTGYFGRYSVDPNDGTITFYHKLPYSPYFTYYVDSINTESGSDYDVSQERILNSMQEYRKLYDATLKTLYEQTGDALKGVTPESDPLDRSVFLGALASYGGDSFMYSLWKGHKEDVRTLVKATDVIQSESYANSTSWWDKLWAGKLFRLNVDDSVTLPGISTFDYADLSKTDAELSKKYCIDVTEVGKLRSLCTYSSSHKICLIRYLTTEYNVYNGRLAALVGIEKEGSAYTGSFVENGRAYYCENAIIEDFKILRLFFEQTDYTLGRINRTTIMVDETPQDYAGGAESGDKLENEKTDYTAFFPWNWGRQDDKLSVIWKAIRIVVIALVVFILIRLFLRLIPPLRKAFQKSPPDDKPKDKS